MSESDANDTIIIDNGSGYIKAGLTSDETPQCVFPTVVGKPRRRFEELYADMPSLVGEQVMAERHHLSFRHPIDHGHIDDWLLMEEIWNYTFDCLNVDAKNRSVLLTEPPLCSSNHREKMAEIMFEVYEISEVNISVTGLMAIYGIGQTTGFVLDIGEGITQGVPVFDGFLEKTSIKRADFGGQELTMYLQKILCDMGYPMTSRDDYEHVRIIKETLCFCSLNPAADQYRDDLETTYYLPDGQTLRDGVTAEITLGPERFYPAEGLFNPQLCGRDTEPLTEQIWQSITACPIETRKALMGSVVICGGTSMFPGLKERLEEELRNTSPPQARSAVRVICPEGRAVLVWLGARLYANPNLRSIQDHVWVSKEEWEEIGPKIMQIKAAFKASG